MKKKMIRYSLLFLVALTQLSLAQQTKAKLEKVSEKNFYRIRVLPEIRSASKINLGDLRIFDSQKNEVPYLIETQLPKTETNQFEPFSILSKSSIAKKTSTIIVENPKPKISELTLLIANSDANKKLSISGSNDQKQWFGIANSIELFDMNNPNSTQVTQTISFPMCSYKFLKIDFDDSKTLPVNVLQIGSTNSSFQMNEWEEIQPKNRFITQLPKQKKTLHHVVLNQSQNIEKLAIKVKEPTLFNRAVSVYTLETKKINNATTTNQEIITEFTLSSKGSNEFAIVSGKINECYIEISNEDNPPLNIESIQLFQRPLFLIAELDPKEDYTVVTGDDKLFAPSYDLAHFENEIKNAAGQIKMTHLEQKTSDKKISEQPSFWQQSWFMWMCIILAGITILYFSVSLAKEMKK
ncbi:MAG: hypothetical protein JNJ52_04650 [Flavobacterium sp.]|nr:hypothetical protein [Flavobacterium sp.]